MTTPPIASPYGSAEPLPSKPPFRGLRVFVAVDAVFLLLGPLRAVCSPHIHEVWRWTAGFYAVFIPLWGLLLWRLWHGSGVARASFWWFNALLLLGAALTRNSHQGLPLVARCFDWADEAFLVFALIWLHLPGVKAHFRREKAV